MRVAGLSVIQGLAEGYSLGEDTHSVALSKLL